jgi:UDP-N-acetylmuramate: L-alanyl-gamma-D-glutamyl-meso-diaminopimelate ligase
MTRLELDPSLNYLPENVKTIHMIGICGTGMAALAGMLKEKGFDLTGSDANVYPPMSDFLVSLDIPVMSPYDPANLDHRPDLVVVGNVVTRENPETPRLKELGLPYLSLPQIMKMLFLKDKKPLVAAGTHGKTTTSTLAAWLLESLGKDPGFFIGGITGNFGRNYKLGHGDWFVVEGDEYDTAFFDKVPKFIHYAPFVGILTSVEFDHADIYPDLEAVKAAFRQFVDLIPADGLLVAWGDDPLVRQMAEPAKSKKIFYGLGEDADYRAENLVPDGRRTRFHLVRPGRPVLDMFSPLPGEHNVLNTLAVVAALEFDGIDPADLLVGLSSFKGVKRRQEIRGEVDGVLVMDDFAHHPTAVRQTVSAIRKAYPDRRLWAVFEPRTNTSMRRVFQTEYAEAFDLADQVAVRQAPDLKKVPPGEQFNFEQLVDDLNRRGLSAVGFPDTDALLDHLLNSLVPNDLVLIMSNGGFDNLHQRLLDGLEKR